MIGKYVTSSELLRALLKIEGVCSPPKKREYSGEWVEATFSIGDDHTCDITMTKEAYDKLFEYAVL